MSLPYNRNFIDRARELRKNATPQENHLWYDFLGQYPVRFQRQKTIRSFIVDFFCDKAMLAIEIDGMQHLAPDNVSYDEERTGLLNEFGILVIRFTNQEIDHCFEEVCQQIDSIVKQRLQ